MTVVLLSGGLDSAVCLDMVATGNWGGRLAPASRGCVCVFVDYGQPHMVMERERARTLAARYERQLHEVQLRLPYWKIDPQDKAMIVPGRNLVLISIAATFGSPVVIGCNLNDYKLYEDCRPEFFDALGVVHVLTPLIKHPKSVIGATARSRGITDGETWSCYYPLGGTPCGACGACVERAKAFPPEGPVV